MSALTSITRCLRRLKFRTIKHAPELFMYAGIAGTVVATVSACKKTSNMPQIAEEHEAEVKELKKRASETPMNEYRKEMATIYMHTGVKIVRNYAMPAAIGIVSVGSILYGHRILNRRYIATSVALTAMTKDYNNLYDNLVAEVGEERSKEIKAGIISENVEETFTDVNGKDTTVVTTKKKLSGKGSMYTLKFDAEHTDYWVQNFEQNYFTVSARAAELESSIANRETGHEFWLEAVEFMFGTKGLKKILDDFKEKGISVPTLAGWIYDPERAKNINIEYMADPEDPYSVLVVLIPDGVINELGVGKKGLKAIAAA